MCADVPAPARLDDALELAEILRSTWPEMQAEVRRTAAFLNDGEEPEAGAEEQPSSGDEHSPNEENQPTDGDEESSFLDDYDLGDVPEEARPVAEAAVKRLQSAYTKQRQQDTQAVREASEAQSVVEALTDPQRAPAVLQALYPDQARAILDAFGPEAGAEEEFAFDDPNDRIDALEAQLRQRDEVAQAEDRVRAENAFVTEQINALEDELGTEFTEDEIGLLYMYADEYRDARNRPDVKAAHKVLDGIVATAQQRLIKSKGRAPRRMVKGAAADRQVDLSNPEQRRAAMEQAFAAAQASSQ